MKKLAVLTTSIGAVLASVPAQGQLKPEAQTGSLIPVKPQQLDAKDAGYIRKQFAACVYHNTPKKVLALLDHSDAASVDLDAAGIRHVSDELDMSTCLGRETRMNEYALGMKFPPAALRDLMAEEVYLSHYRTTPTLASDAAPLDGIYVSGDDRLATAKGLNAFVDCTIRGDLAHADAVVRTMPGSDAEHQAAAALAPALGRCMTQGQQIKLTQNSIRALIAYGLWARFVRVRAS